jgi:hypothetical protein
VHGSGQGGPLAETSNLLRETNATVLVIGQKLTDLIQALQGGGKNGDPETR